jgi:hypothetical protein
VSFLTNYCLNMITPPRGRRRFFGTLRSLAPLLFYFALSLAFFERKVNWSDYYFGYSTDPVSFIWFLNWWPFAISHGLNPFVCKYVWFPAGFNFTWATAVPFLALLSWPITVFGSPVLSYNILILSAPAFAAWTAFLLGRELTQDWAASLICGFLFGFSGPEFGEMLSALNLATVFLIPIVVLLCVRRVQGRMNRWPFIIFLSLVLVAQLGISTEVFMTLCVLGAFTWVIFLAMAPAAGRKGLWRVALDIGIAAPLVMFLTAPFLYYLVKGLSDVRAQIGLSFWGSADLRQFAFPAVPIRPGWAAFDLIKKQFSGFTPDIDSYIGIPLLLILVLYFYRNISAAYVRALLASICMVAMFSLGSILLFGGKFYNIPLPWALFSHVPVIRSVITNRLLTYVTLGTAIAAALFLAEPNTAASRLPRYALAGLACLFLIPARVQVLREQWLTQPIIQERTEFKWTRWPVQPFFTSAHIKEALGLMPNVILLPDTTFGPGMAWQVDTGFNFTQATGYVGFRPLREQKWGVLDEIAFGPPRLGFDAALSAFCAAHHVDYILIGPGTPGSVVSAIEGLGWPRHMDDGIEVVKVPASLE